MTNTIELSEAKRVLLEKYLGGRFPQTPRGTNFIPRHPQSDVAPLSYGQQQLWLLAQLLPDTPVYTECVTIHIPGLLDDAALERSFNEFIRRHEAWRTSFPLVDGQPVQMIHPTPTFTLPVVDLRYLPEAEREAEALRLATEDAKIPFDIANGPLQRATLIHLEDMEHRLVLTLHHIIFDGVALYQVFLPEMWTLYEAFSKGKPSPLPPLPIKYADYAIWQRESLAGEVFADQLSYWKQQLADAPALLELPTDRPRPQVTSYNGSTRPFSLSKQLTDALKALGRREGVTLYMILVAAFQALLYRHTGQEDLLIGMVTAGRRRKEVEKLMGFFLNTLVLRTDLSGNPTFRELLKRVREVTLDAQVYQDLPFEYLVKELHPERNAGQNPLIQVMISLEPALPVLPSGWTLTQMDVETETAKFDLSLELDDRQEGLIGRFEYRTDLFDELTIDRMAGHWQTLLEGIVDDPEQCIEYLPLLTETERQLLLVELNATQTAYLKDQCVHQLFEAQVERTPDAIAVVFEGQQLTYRELNKRANQLAHYLRGRGVGPDVLVGVCMERSLDMVIALLGVLKAGGAYVPLDPTSPKERMAFMLEDMQTSILLTQQKFVSSLPTHNVQTLCLDTMWAPIANEVPTNPVCNVSAENLSYTIYTSGSTGKPKGAMNIHRGLVNRLLWMQQEYQLTAEDRVLQKTPFTFDVSVWEFFWPLLTGATLVVARPGGHQDASYIASLIAEQRITTLHFVPSMLQIFLQAPDLEPCNKSLQRVICSGEALPFALQERFFARMDADLHNLYGPTEASIDVTYWHCQRESQQHIVPIGRPIANTQIYLVDSSMRPVPIGATGELYIGGVGVARGYLNRAELTRERFVADPFSTQPDARLYRTGDLARYRADGAIEYLGRLDHQVKIRGFRIELGEIEEALRQHPEVRETVVMAPEDTMGDKYLVAYIVAVQGRTPLIKNLRSFLKEKLPEYMVPSAFMLLDALPLTSNGKIDRRALPTPKFIERAEEESYVALTLLVHQQLIEIWEELLDQQPVQIKDNFFDVGGHSLLAARLVARIEQVCGKKVPLATLFANPTIEQLVNALQTEEERHSRTPIVAVQASGSKRPFFYLHGAWNSEAFHCFHLARQVGPDQPFYALEPYHFDDLQVAPTVEDMAAAHIQSIRNVQPEGPYLLGGFCNGGLTAYEMARQLQAQGQKVDLLVLIDPADYPILHKLVYGAIRRVGQLLRLGQDKQLEWFLRLRHTYKYLRHERSVQNLKAFRAIDPSIQTLFPSADALRQDNIALWNWIVMGYGYTPYPGKATLFWAHEEPFRGVWRRKAAQEKDIEMHVIPGTHIGCLTDHVQALAEELRKCLSQAQVAKLKESEYGENVPVSVD